MKKIVKVVPFIDSDGKRAIEVIYTKGKKIYPFSEDLLMAFKDYLDNDKKKIIKDKVKVKTNTKNIDINMDKFADYIMNEKNRDLIVRRIKIVLFAIGLAYLAKYIHDDFSTLPDVILPEEEKEEVVTYDVGEYYANLDSETMTK